MVKYVFYKILSVVSMLISHHFLMGNKTTLLKKKQNIRIYVVDPKILYIVTKFMLQ